MTENGIDIWDAGDFRLNIVEKNNYSPKNISDF